MDERGPFEATNELRWVMRDGQRVLQQKRKFVPIDFGALVIGVAMSGGTPEELVDALAAQDKWVDVPLVDEGTGEAEAGE